MPKSHEALISLEQVRKAELVLLDLILPSGREGETGPRYSAKTVRQKLREFHKTRPPVIVLRVVSGK